MIRFTAILIAFAVMSSVADSQGSIADKFAIDDTATQIANLRADTQLQFNALYASVNAIKADVAQIKVDVAALKAPVQTPVVYMDAGACSSAAAPMDACSSGGQQAASSQRRTPARTFFGRIFGGRKGGCG